MKPAVYRSALLISLLVVAHGAQADPSEVKVPRGWTDTMREDTRVVSNDNSTIEISPWESLHGQSVKAWLTAIEKQAPKGGELVSSKGVISESVKGAYSVTRAARYNGRKGHSILYACPGQNEHVQLMTLDVRNGSFLDVLRGARFGESLCKLAQRESASAIASAKQPNEPQSPPTSDSGGPPPQANQQPVSAALTGNKNLRALNALIPAASRPTVAYAYLKQRWSGFPAQLTYEARMMLRFSNGNFVSCAEWNPAEYAPTARSIGRAIDKCEITRQQPKGEPLKGFSPGQTIDIEFGNVSADSFPSGGSMSGSDLVMTRDGRIAIGKFQINSMREGNNSSTSTRRSQGLVGRYYLDGYTITIVTESGDVRHGFVGFRSEDNSRGFDHVYVNGEHFWDRRKK